MQITWYLSSLTVLTAVVGTVWLLLGSSWNGQAALYVFQKYLLCWEHAYNVSCIQTTSVTFCLFFYNLFMLKVFDIPRFLKRNCTVLRVLQQFFWNGQEAVGAPCAVLPSWPACLFIPPPLPMLSGIKLSGEDSKMIWKVNLITILLCGHNYA
jgi:hypothetical protein